MPCARLAERDDIKAVFLDIDSPGGTVAGTPELAATVASINAQKPVYAFSSGLMCSAAYWIASQARAIYATPSARVGSIGVVQAVIDDTAALDAKGIKVEVFAVGKYKAMGAPGTPLTDDQRELINSNLAETAGEFHAAVLARGRSIPPEAMEGQTFSGRQAQRFNLAGMVSDRAEAMRRLRVYHAAVDTESRAMNTAPEDLLAEARIQVADLQRDNKTQTDLLVEARTQVELSSGTIKRRPTCWPRRPPTSRACKGNVRVDRDLEPSALNAIRQPAMRPPCKPASPNSRRHKPISTPASRPRWPALWPPPAPRFRPASLPRAMPPKPPSFTRSLPPSPTRPRKPPSGASSRPNNKPSSSNTKPNTPSCPIPSPTSKTSRSPRRRSCPSRHNCCRSPRFPSTSARCPPTSSTRCACPWSARPARRATSPATTPPTRIPR